MKLGQSTILSLAMCAVMAAGCHGQNVASGQSKSAPTTNPTTQRVRFKKATHVPVVLDTAPAVLPPVGYTLVFEENFDGKNLDQAKWDYRTDSKLKSTQLPENVSVADGLLKIALKKQSSKGKPYTGGGITSQQTFVYAYYEARFRTPPVEGWHTSFWGMHTNSEDDKPKAQQRRAIMELDFCEQDGGDPKYFSFGIVNQSPDASKGQTWNGGRWVVEDAPDTSADFHVWACEMTPDKIRFYFDGRLAKEADSTNFSHDPISVMFSCIAGVMKGDRFVDESKLPNTAELDYIRVYTHPKYQKAEEEVREKVAKMKKGKSPTSPTSRPAGTPQDLN